MDQAAKAASDMKRYGNLWSQIVDFDNLLLAARKAQKGKRQRTSVLAFNYDLETELFRLQSELKNKIWQPGPYKTFQIVSPKKRLISAAPYRDRVIHHALCNVICPIFERTFISDSYANRKDYGTHRALRRFTEFARSSQYILQCDIRKYFPSIDHAILKQILRRKIKCSDTLWLIDTIIDASNPQEPVADFFPGDDLFTSLERRRGLPIGNLTSQFFANVYLNGLDHFIKQELLFTKYLRYVDDFALFGDDPDKLMTARTAIENYLSVLRLRIHPIKSQLFRTERGAGFVGFRILPEQIRIRNESLRRARQRHRELRQLYKNGRVELAAVTQSLRSWIGHLQHGDTWQLREKVFSHLVFTRN